MEREKTAAVFRNAVKIQLLCISWKNAGCSDRRFLLIIEYYTFRRPYHLSALLAAFLENRVTSHSEKNAISVPRRIEAKTSDG